MTCVRCGRPVEEEAVRREIEILNLIFEEEDDLLIICPRCTNLAAPVVDVDDNG